ncbi:MAG: ribonuclease T2 [Paracoccaceae bacterium]
MRWLIALALTALPAFAGGERAGEFDYYVLSLSWSPTYCAIEGDAKGDDQCDPRHDYSFTLHGLWPQFENGWPSYCPTAERPPSRGQTAGMVDIMGSSGLAWYEWKKHGVCSGLSPQDYFAASRRAYEQVAIPDVFLRLRKDLTLPASVVEAAFVDANPELGPNMITITCDHGHIREARICLTRDFAFRSCGPDAARDCRMKDARMEAVR